MNDISLLNWNPNINQLCTNLDPLAETLICVSPPRDDLGDGTITTTTQPLSTTEPIITPIVELPIAPGTPSDCDGYIDHFSIPAIADQSVHPDTVAIINNDNTCDYATTFFEVPLADFLSWNPSLASVDPCILQEGYRYCGLNGTSFLPPPIIEDDCLEYYADHPHPGIISTCTCFTAVDGRSVGLQLCSDIAEDFDITPAQLTSWNPWIGTDCDTGVYSGLGVSDSRAVCVGVGGSGGGGAGPIT